MSTQDTEKPWWHDELILAARRDNLDYFKKVTRSTPQWQQVAHSYKFSDGAHGTQPLLHIAASHGSLGVLQWMLAQGMPLETQAEPDGATALYAAAKWGKLDAVAMLLRAGADPHARARMGIRTVTADHIAKDRGHDDIAAMIIAAQQPVTVPRVLQVPKLKFSDRKF